MAPRRVLLCTILLLESATLALGIWAASAHVAAPSLGGLGAVSFGWAEIAIFVAVFALFTFTILHWRRAAQSSLGIFLGIAILVGVQYIVSPLLPSPWWASWSVAALVLVLWHALPRVLVHDVAIAAGIGGLCALLGLSLTPLAACGLLAVLSVYDVISVYRTRHMVALAGRMLESGSVFGFLVPARPRVFLMPVREALDQKQVMMLGSGDVGLPLVLAASAAITSTAAAAMVAVFSLIGLTVMQWLFMHQERPAPMAALPPIAAAAILGYAFAVILGI
jgi:presenilin-like A22 family membrane protease